MSVLFAVHLIPDEMLHHVSAKKSRNLCRGATGGCLSAADGCALRLLKSELEERT